MEFKDVLDKYKLYWDGFVFTLKESQDNYIVKYEGYAYVLYKEIFICSENTLEPIAHFRDPKRLDIFLEILFEKFDKDGWKEPEQITHTLEGVMLVSDMGLNESKDAKIESLKNMRQEALNKALDINPELKTCEKPISVPKTREWQEFIVRKDGDVKEIKFEDGVLITIRMPSPEKDKKWVPEKYIGLRGADDKTTGNLFDMWIEQEDGSFKCASKNITLPREAILEDLETGCLGKMKEHD